MHLPSWNMVITFGNNFLWSETKNDLFGQNQAQRIGLKRDAIITALQTSSVGLLCFGVVLIEMLPVFFF